MPKRLRLFVHGSCKMIDAFKDIQKKLEQYDSKREELIKKSREVLKDSKQLIYALHRHNDKQASDLFKKVKQEKKELDNITLFDKKLLFEGSYAEACQEYAEALSYNEFIKSGKIPSCEDLNIDYEDYLMGICDLTGELVRRAVSLTTTKKFKEVEEIKDFVEEIYGEFLKFDLRNGNLRKKYDSIKWNLKKLEEVMYDIKTKK